ncbi:hypothetical protein D9757_001991 [Collybiopsis confluens]|uniref:Zn(2)-C6 fungal-type domain-containing protein n=1 Tax=Collybiopsis confluens TaxID=2823264 RepID=A0A8H5MEU9_9AGAR|nr:hypothetical protein D9757_001991 [Collybiopsis confluens]
MATTQQHGSPTDAWDGEISKSRKTVRVAEAAKDAARSLTTSLQAQSVAEKQGLGSPEADNEDHLSEESESDDRGAYPSVERTTATSGKTLPKIKLKIQPNFDDPESEEETGNQSPQTSPPSTSALSPLASSSKQQSNMGGKTVPKAKPKEVLSIRDPPCWRCKQLHKPCEASSLRFSCNTCYKRHWACSSNPPPPRQKKVSHLHSVSAPPKTKSTANSTTVVGESISVHSVNRGRSPLRSGPKPVKRPRSATPNHPNSAPVASTSQPQNKKTRTSLRTIIKPQQVNGSAPTADSSGPSRSRPTLSSASQHPRLTDSKDLKIQINTLVQHDEQNRALLERHSLLLDAVLENMKVLLGDKFIEVKGKHVLAAPSAAAGIPTSFDADIDELDELTPIEQSPEPSQALTSMNGNAPSSTGFSAKGYDAGSSRPVDTLAGLRVISVASHTVEKDRRKPTLSNGRKLVSPSSFNGASTALPISSARSSFPPYRAILSASRTTTDNDEDGVEEEVDDDARSIPGISALPAASSPTSTTSVDDPEGGYIADGSHGPAPAPIAKAPSFIAARRESSSSTMLPRHDASDMQVEYGGLFPRRDMKDLDEEVIQ